ncbi:MAG: OsmC family protein [Anaerolineae bacterium]|jgi:putative redox protein|nr:OsmC family protein [Anaerolineae bacterium]
MKATVQLTDGYRTTITSRGHTYHADEPETEGGADSAPTPSEMLMGALGSCIAITIKLYAGRKGWPLTGVDVALDYERFKGDAYADYAGEAAFVHEIREQVVLHGDLTADQRDKLLEIASKCPVSRVIELPAFFQRTLLAALPD